jgi:tetratricopeptide (TPR) repeat protein
MPVRIEAAAPWHGCYQASWSAGVLVIAASAWTVIASPANADRFSYRDDGQCADTPNAETAIAACTHLYENGTLGPINRAIALGNRGAAAKFLGRYDRAMADFTLAIGLDPRNPQYFCQRGDVLRRQRAFKDAVADYTAALARAPGSACAYKGRGQAYLAQGNTQQALADIAQALRSKPGSFQLLVLRGRANNQAKQYELAIADFSQALASKSQSSLPPNDRAAIRSERALALLKLDRSADARADVEEALRIAPENASTIATMGLIDEELGRKPEATASYTRALAIKPDLEDAKRGLERLGLPAATTPQAPAPAPEPTLETSFTATLYKIITLASGEHRTSTNAFPSLAQCEAAVKFLHTRSPLRDKTLVYCVKHAGPTLHQRRS